MDVVTILLTDDRADAMGDFVHDGRRYAFARLAPAGPQALLEGPVWVFIDWIMDEIAGLEMCRRLRADPRTAHAHVTMILEGDNPEDRRRALKAGADDYATGPLDRRQILDRVIAVDPDTRLGYAPGMLDCGRLRIDLRAQQARWDGIALALPPNEFRLLRYFAEHANTVLARQDLIAGIGKQEPPVDVRTVDVWVGRLRRALKQVGAGDALRTVRSAGYVLDLGP